MNQVSDVKVRTWTPAVPCKIPDNIVSSQFASMKVFVPSYEKEEQRPCMEQLLTNEYQRIWWQEKETWDKRFGSKITTKKLLQRMVIRKKPPRVAAAEKAKKIKKPKKKSMKMKETIGKEQTSVEEKTDKKEEPKDEESIDKPCEEEKTEEIVERESTKENQRCKDEDEVEKTA